MSFPFRPSSQVGFLQAGDVHPLAGSMPVFSSMWVHYLQLALTSHLTNEPHVMAFS